MSQAVAVSVEAIAKTLVEKCKKGEFAQAIKELYGQNVVSVEAFAPPGKSREVKGLDAIIEKSAAWAADNEVHNLEVVGPLVAGNFFSVVFKLDVTCKSMNNTRFQMEEVAVYEVKDNKIVREEFFYSVDK
ncbi:MAG: nuclear transport factor 2 family protein [Cyanobacteria bacterium]|nr:nuclear transport factor 2 family protein [Cyanobacteriota bacterium]